MNASFKSAYNKMNKPADRVKRRLLRILAPLPNFKKKLTSDFSLEKKREELREYLTNIIISNLEDDINLPSLKWVLSHEAVQVFRNLLSRRNERMSGHSFLKYLDKIINSDNYRRLEKPSPAFLAELNYLVRGLAGKAGIYPVTPPAFLKYNGIKAAQMRSSDLSRMANRSLKQIQRYTHGLEHESIRQRSRNHMRILNYFKSTGFEWKYWKWHVRHIIRDADTLRELVELTDDEYQAIKLANKNKIPFGITPYYVSLFDKEKNSPDDRAIRAQVIPSLNYIEKMKKKMASRETSMDFMLENDTSPIEGITHRYPHIVIVKPLLTCPQICVYCQRNWEIEDVYSKKAVLSKEKLDRALSWIKDRPEINEVLITGGDPFLLSNKNIEKLLTSLADNPNIIRIRIGTRTLVTLPQRITDPLVRTINRFHIPGRREIIIITHFEHPYEITPISMDAVQRFKRYGIDVYNQLVYTYYNSRRFEAVALRQLLRLIGVTPYYTFNTKGKEESNDFRVPIARVLQEQKEEARLLPGTVRTDDTVFNVPGLGKNYLRASQHHSIISILPNGRRIYEFHPWEKKLSLVDTYVYTDVSIYDYLERLKKDGEDISRYKSIWYYY